MNKEFSFNIYNNHAKDGVQHAIKECNQFSNAPIIVCIGSDLVLGDSLGPLVGTLLKSRNFGAYVYGTLNMPITAKEIKCAKNYLKEMHPSSAIIAIDAAIGDKNDIGLIKVFEGSLKPGLGVNKDLGSIGDVSIIGIVASKSLENYNLFNLTRLNLVYKMAEIIADALESYLLTEQQKSEKVSGA
ncbi:MAG: spore protease YyaC [Clostridia bacterium]|nr:spore protease YyaC [Clostridia bacterium]